MHRIFEHTADLGIEASGDTLGEALSAAGQALSQIVTGNHDLHAAPPDGELAFRIEAPDESALVVAFLSELLWFLESENLLWLRGGAEVQEGASWVLEARGNAAVYDSARHGQGTEVKAITYHGLEVARGKQVRIRVIVDI